MLGFALVLGVGYAVKVYKPELLGNAFKKPEQPAQVSAPQAGAGTGTNTGTKAPATQTQTPAQTQPTQTTQPAQPPKQETPAPAADPNKAILEGRTRIDRSGGVARTMTIVPFYADGLKAGDTLLPVEVLVPASTTRIKDTVTHLIDAPENLKLFSNFPKGTKVLGVNLKDGVATVDLSPEAANVQGSGAAQAIRAALVYSLTDIEGVKSVQLWINGRPAVLHGIEWSKPVARADLGTQFKVDPLVKYTAKP